MPKVTVTIPVLVTLDVPEEYAGQVTQDDIQEMAQNAIPDSMEHPDPETGLGGCRNGVQVVVDGVCKFNDPERKDPAFADVFIEHDCTADLDYEFEDPGFTNADPDESEKAD